MSSQRAFRVVFVSVAAALIGIVLGRVSSGGREFAVTSLRHSSALHDTSALPPSGSQVSLNASGTTARSEQRQLPSTAVGAADNAGKSAPLITFMDNRLSAHVRHGLLTGILEKILSLSEVPVILSDGIKNQVVSVHFDNLPLEQGLQIVLQELDAFFFYAAPGSAPAVLQAVWVYPQGQGKRLVPLPPEAWASMTEMREYLYDSDPDMRARAAETLVERQGKRALDAVLLALEDEDEKVRYRALYQAIHAGVTLGTDVLQHLLRSDLSPTVRFLALEALVNMPNVPAQELRRSAELALNDPHEVVQEHARVILDELETAGDQTTPDASTQGQNGMTSQ